MNKFDFSKSEIFVLGDVMKDSYLIGQTHRVSPEAPVPIVKVSKRKYSLGGAANVSENITSLGGSATLFSLTGFDSISNDIEIELKRKKIRYFFTKSKKINTPEKLRVISQNQQLIRLDFEGNYLIEVEKKTSMQLFLKFKKNLIKKNVTAVILSDYLKGTLINCSEYIDLLKKRNIPVFIDPKGVNFLKYKNATLLKPNFNEFVSVVGSIKSNSEFLSKALKLCKQLNLIALLVTKGADGMTLILNNGNYFNFKVHNYREVFDVTGAGDTVLATLASAYSSGYSLEKCVEIANVCAGISVSKLGTNSPKIGELNDEYEAKKQNLKYCLDNNSKNYKKNKNKFKINKKQNKFYSIKNLILELKKIRKQNKQIVFTNGCFDVFHAGHVHILNESKKLGDVLVVAINGDRSIRSLKGPNRPINNLKARIAVLDSIEAIDYIVSFNTKTPDATIKKIQPSYLTKGDDYDDKKIVGSDFVKSYGGQVKKIKMLTNLSSSIILNKLNLKKK